MPRVGRILLFALPLLLVWWLYGSAITLPFYTDDANHYRFFQSVEGIAPLWLGQTWSPYYRPLIYSVWFAVISLQGSYDPIAHHFLNLPVYGLSGVVMALLVTRLVPLARPRAQWIGIAAGCGFVLFPFHYQAIYQVGSLFHLSLTLGVLFAVLAGMRAIASGSVASAMLAALAAFVANFSHETGFMVAPLLVGSALVANQWRITRRLIAVCAAPVIISGVYITLWLLLPRVGTEGGLRFSQSILDNFAVLTQPFFYPLAALVRPFVDGKGSPTLMLTLLAVWTGGGLLVIWRCGRRFVWVGVGGIIWYLMGIALPVVMLQPDYVWSSPRLTMLASAGAVMFACMVAVSIWTAAAPGHRVRRITIVVIAGVIALFNLNFLGERQSEYHVMRDYAWNLMAEMQRAGAPTNGALLVNAPYYIEANEGQRAFLVQAQFASFMSPEVNYVDYLEINSPGVRYMNPVEEVGVGRVMLHQDHLFVTTIPLIDGEALRDRLQMARPVVMTQHHNGTFYPVWVGFYGQTVPATPIARFGEAITLTAVEPLEIVDGRLRVVLQWQVEQPLPAKVFVHVLRDGQMLAQGDGYAWGDLYPFNQWQRGEQQIDRREIPLPPDTELGTLEVIIGLYNETSGERYTIDVIDSNYRVSDDAVLLPQ